MEKHTWQKYISGTSHTTRGCGARSKAGIKTTEDGRKIEASTRMDWDTTHEVGCTRSEIRSTGGMRHGRQGCEGRIHMVHGEGYRRLGRDRVDGRQGRREARWTRGRVDEGHGRREAG